MGWSQHKENVVPIGDSARNHLPQLREFSVVFIPQFDNHRVHWHWLGYFQKISAWPLETMAYWTFVPSMNSSATVLLYRSVVMRRMATFWPMSIPFR